MIALQYYIYLKIVADCDHGVLFVDARAMLNDDGNNHSAFFTQCFLLRDTSTLLPLLGNPKPKHDPIHNPFDNEDFTKLQLGYQDRATCI